MKYPALKAAVLHCISNGVQIPETLLSYLGEVGLGELKELQDYDNNLTRLVAIRIQQLRQTLVVPGSFGEDLADAIDAGLNEAWLSGLRENDVEQTDEWQAILDGIIAEEKTHIPDLSQYLADMAPEAEAMGDAIAQARNRIGMWIQRYEDVRNQAILISAEEKTKLEWVVGATEESCSICQRLNGLVAYAREWEELGVRPQNPPNPALSKDNGGCGGWKCLCELRPTDRRRSPDVYGTIMNIVSR